MHHAAPIQQDAAGAQIAVGKAIAVDVFQPIQQFTKEGQAFVQRLCPFSRHQVGHRLAGDDRFDEVRAGEKPGGNLVTAGGEQRDDVPMGGETAANFNFPFTAGYALFVSGDFEQQRLSI